MKKLLLVFAFGIWLSPAFSQQDTLVKPVAPLSIRANIFQLGAIVQPGRPKVEAPYGYGLFYGKPKTGFSFAPDLQFFFYDKYGITLGYEFNSFAADTDPGLAAYDGNAHAGYFVPAKSSVDYACNAAYIELVRRFSVGNFCFEPAIHIGNGHVEPYSYSTYMKQEGTNFWKFIQYESKSGNAWNYGLKTAIYFRHKSTNFLYMNAHLKLGFYMSSPKYSITYTEKYYGQSQTAETFTVKDKLYWFHIGIAANVEWRPEKYR